MGVVAPTRIPFWCSVIAAGGGACSNSVVRRIRYVVAMSLDGYIAGPKGEADWIIMDPGFDFGSMFRQFDTALIGRRTFEGMVRAGSAAMPGMKTLVFSRTLRQRDYPDVTVVGEKAEEAVAALVAPVALVEPVVEVEEEVVLRVEEAAVSVEPMSFAAEEAERVRAHEALLREVEREKALLELDRIKFEREKMSLELDILREKRKRVAAFASPAKVVVKIKDSPPPVVVVEILDSPPLARIPRVWDCEGDRIRAAYLERAEKLIRERALLSSCSSSSSSVTPVTPVAPVFLPCERVEREEGELCDLPTDLVELLDQRPAICASRELCAVVNSLPK